MPTRLLTDRFVMTAKAKGPQTDYFDEKMSGLALRVSEGGSRGWTFLFTSPKDHKRARVKLGTYPGTSLAAARTKAEECRGYLEEDPPRDPRDVLAAQAAKAITVENLFDDWIEKGMAGKRSVEHVKRRMRKNVLPVIGSVAIAVLHRRDVNRVTDIVVKRGSPTEATNVFRNVRAMVRWAVERGDLDRNPMEGMSQPSEDRTRDHTLTDEDVSTVWRTLPSVIAKSQDVQRITKLCLITGQRIGEVAGLERSELDLKAKLWTIPEWRTKNGCEHKVPLSEMALSIIGDAMRATKAEHLFPSEDDDARSIRPRAAGRTMTRAQAATKDNPKGKFGVPAWTAHDLRRTVLTNLAKLGVQPIVIGSVANHLSVTKANVTFANYVQYDYAKEKRAALDLWAERLAAIIEGGAADVVLMERKRA